MNNQNNGLIQNGSAEEKYMTNQDFTPNRREFTGKTAPKKHFTKLFLLIFTASVFLGGCTSAGKPDSSGNVSAETTAATYAETNTAQGETETQAEMEVEVEAETEAETENETESEAETETETTTEADMNVPDAVSIDNEFYITEITDDIFSRIKGKSFKDDCTLPREDLRYLHVLHKDIHGETHEGEMIVNRHIAEDVLEILKTLYEESYPIEKIRLIDEYDADDEASMEDNNSSCFNYRLISYSNRISKHGLGLAVDINTLYNPYVKTVNGKRSVEPVNAEPYLDRDKDFDYKIEREDLCCRLFLEHGFAWGGDWTSQKDYQHFEIPSGRIAEWYPER